MEDIYFRKIMTTIILVILIVLTFFLLRPILLSIIAGLILAFIFYPVYARVNKIIKSPNISAGLLCFLLFILIGLPIFFLVPIVLEQSVRFFSSAKEIDFIELIRNVFPSLFSITSSGEIGSIIQSFVNNATSNLLNSISEFFLNLPTFFLQSLVVFFTYFFSLRDKDKLIQYIKSLSPFSKEIEKKFFDSSKTITNSVIYGQIVIGTIQGLVIGLGYFIFGVPNALILTLLSCMAGIFPIIGTSIVWIPVLIYLFITGNSFSVVGITIFGLLSSSVDNLLRPIFVSKFAKMNSLLILIGMIGGFFFFGILGFILGPLILAYLLILLEIYRTKNISGIFVFESKECSR